MTGAIVFLYHSFRTSFNGNVHISRLLAKQIQLIKKEKCRQKS